MTELVTAPIIVTLPVLADSTLQGWRAFYADGSTTDSKQTVAALAPSLNAHCVVVYSTTEYLPGRPYREIFSGYDTYVIDGSTIVGTIDKTSYLACLATALQAETL